MASIKIISLDELYAGGTKAVSEFTDSVIKRGFAFLSLQKEEKTTKLAQDNINRTVTACNGFFSANDNYKQHYFFPPVFGYTSLPHKEGFRYLTGSHFVYGIMPNHFQNVLSVFLAMEEVLIEITGHVAKDLFGSTVNELGKKMSLPCLQEDDKEKHYAMVDIVKYYNKEILDSTNKKVPEMNCMEHYDPGLFSLNIVSTEPGLQLFDHNSNTWVDCPPDTAVIWCGKAAVEASNGRIKPGKHRVLYSEKPRITIWLELITSNQVPPETHEKGILAFDTRKKNEVADKMITAEMYDDWFEIEKVTGIPWSKRRNRWVPEAKKAFEKRTNMKAVTYREHRRGAKTTPIAQNAQPT